MVGKGMETARDRFFAFLFPPSGTRSGGRAITRKLPDRFATAHRSGPGGTHVNPQPAWQSLSMGGGNESIMLVVGEAVGHAGQVVRHAAREPIDRRDITELFRQELGLRGESVE